MLDGSPGTPAALAGQGYVALAREDADRAVSRFDDALVAAPALTAALVGKDRRCWNSSARPTR